MRRLIVILGSAVLLLASVSPAMAARPIKSSGAWQQANAFSSSCETQGANTVCTDVGIDAFAFDDEFSDACVWMFTYSVGRNGQFRPISDASGCAPASSFSVAAGASSAQLSATQVQLYSCNQRTCVAGDTVTVAASWTAISGSSTYSGRATYTDGSCTYRQSWSGASSQASASFSVGTTDYVGDGFILREDFTVTERCR
ncbi:MAG TPA: hypothetical protein VM344_10750 [Vitreimonas sp.]|jgi:hypothetical protein|nr:hypothetical protein [Vitreimonas sp.]